MTRAPLPRAEIAPGPLRRLWRWLRERGAAPAWLHDTSEAVTAALWSASGAVAAGLVTGAIVAIAAGVHDLDLPTSLLWLVLMVCGGLFGMFFPFLASYMGWMLLRHVSWARQRPVAAFYGAVFHLGAQALLGLWLLGDLIPPIMSIAPLIIGGLWGSWLPATYAARSRR